MSTLAMPASAITRVTVNRAPVLTLWAAVVAERLGFDWNELLTLGRAVAVLNAYAKGKALGIFIPNLRILRRNILRDDDGSSQLSITLRFTVDSDPA